MDDQASPVRGFELIAGDAETTLRQLEPLSVQTVVTSPPYWALRDYEADGQIGLESVPEYVDRIVRVFREVRRHLRPDGTLWVNLGDTYVGSRSGRVGASSVTSGRNHRAAIRAAQNLRTAQRATSKRVSGLPSKSLVGIPWRVALALQDDGWLLRSDIIWHKPTAMPETVSDRPTRDHEYLFLFGVGPRYYFDSEAVSEPGSPATRPRGRGTNPKSLVGSPNSRQNESWSSSVRGVVERRNVRTVWSIPSLPRSDDHTSAYPLELATRAIRASTRPGDLVLDPFAGRGTTGEAALQLGRHFVGIDINPKTLELARHNLVAQVERMGGLSADQAEQLDRPSQLGLRLRGG